MSFHALRVPVATAFLVTVLAGAGWLDYGSTSRELRALRTSEAETLFETIAAAARVQHAAAQAAEAALGQRLLDHARYLRASDEWSTLDASRLASLVPASAPYRVMVFDASGRRELVAGEAPQGAGQTHGRGYGAGRALGAGGGEGLRLGLGAPVGASRLAQRLFTGDAGELVAEPHASRSGGERIAAGVRRANGGVIVVNAANELARELDSVYSLDALLTQIASATPALAYVVIEDQQQRVARGPLAPAVTARTRSADATRQTSRYTLGSVPVFERQGLLSLDEARTPALRIGMRLDDIQRAERRALLRVAGGLGALATVLGLALALGGLRHRYGALSERHAQAQEALRRRDRLTAMGEMASTVAHEIRNPLNAIAMSAQRLAREHPADTRGDAAELVDVIQREASRINGTVQQFLDFARPRPIHPREIDAAELLAQAAAAAEPAAEARSIHVNAIVTGPIVVIADADQLRQAVDNLLRNAIEATPPGGTITVGAERRGRNTVLEVRDTGTGIPADVLPRVFDLYFTTKREGTGIGLAVVQQIAAAHGGTASIDSRPGTGTRVRIELPTQGVARG